MLQRYFAKVLDYHGSLVTDEQRTESYRRAILETVRPGDVVIDLGTGVGLLALLACRAGAKRVYAIESGRIIHIAEQLAAENGFSDRITFLNCSSFDARLPERADVLVTETIGNFGLDEGIAGAIADARRRLLKEDARIVPRAVEMCIVPVELPEAFRRVESWTPDVAGLDLSLVRNYVANNVYVTQIQADAHLAKPIFLGRADVDAPEGASFGGRDTFVIERAGTLHGIGGWFRAELTKDIVLTNAPDLPRTSWKHCFLPISAPLRVEAGDDLELSLECRSNGAVWRWSFAHRRTGFVSHGESVNGFPLPAQQLK